jgi:hypothetical protein
VIALENALDDLDLADLDARPEAVAAGDQALTAWLNGVTSAEQLRAELVADPRRAFLTPDDPALTVATAARILAARAALGGQFDALSASSLALGGLGASDIADLENTGRALAAGIPGDQCVAVLLPMRIETRFAEPSRPGGHWRMQVRLFPEAAAMDRSPGAPTQDELDHTLAMWQGGDGRLDTPEGKLAFSKLAQQHGGPRAAWLASHFPPVRTGPADPISLGPTAIRATSEPVAHRVAGLPESLEIWIARGGAPPAMVATTRVDAARIAADSTLASLGSADGLPLTWWLSFAQAIEVGLGAIVDLGPTRPDDLDAVYLVGLGDQDAGPLFAAHRDAGTLAVLSPGVPTNSVAGAPAADLGRDPDVWLRQANDTGLTQPAARELEVALTGGTVGLAPLPGGEVDLREPASRLVGALWPALWGRTLKDLLGLGPHAWDLGAWATRCLAPEGSFPAVRIGDQPYGVLPVTSLNRWTTHAQDPAIEAAMIRPLRLLVRRWVQLATAAGTVVGADTDRFVDLLSRTPTSRWGWQVALADELVELLAMARGRTLPAGQLTAEFDGDVIGDMERLFGLAPARRYRSLGPVHPLAQGLLDVTDPRVLVDPTGAGPPSSRPIGRMLKQELAGNTDIDGLARHDPFWWGDADLRQDDSPVPLLARLVRHALVVTRADVARLYSDPTSGPHLTLPLDSAEEPLFNHAVHSETLLSSIEDSGPNGAAAVRSYRTVREAAAALSALPENRIEQALLATLESAALRIDGWPIALATRRLRWLEARHTRFRLGAYGWVDTPRPYRPDPGTSVQPPGPTAAGVIHAPSAIQAMTAALLRDLAVRKPGDTRWDIALDSAAVRGAVALAADVAAGAHLMEALGRRIEQIAGEPGLVDRLRQLFPMRPEHAGRRVCDGEAVLAAALAEPPLLPAELAGLAPSIRPLQSVLDTYGDLLVTDAVHDLVSGRADLAAEAMEAAAGLSRPPGLRVLRTNRSGRTVETTTVAAIADATPAAGAGPAEIADPAFAALLVAELPAEGWQWFVNDTRVTLAELGLTPADALVVPEAFLEAAVGARAGQSAPALIAGPGTATITAARRLAALLAADDGLPRWLAQEAPGAAAAMLSRLAALRINAQTLVDTLRAPGGASALPEAARWGLVSDADELGPDEHAVVVADALAERLAAANAAAGAAAAPIGVEPQAANAALSALRSAIRTLASGSGALPVLYSVRISALAELSRVETAAGGRPAIDESWLEIVAAVLPNLARLDAHQLAGALGLGPRPWQAWTSHRGDPWCAAAAEPAPAPTGRTHAVHIVYGPDGVLEGAGATIAVCQLGRHVETIPSPRQTTGAAFGFNAPKARAPQAILLAVPPDVATAMSTATIVDIVAAARELARARMATPDALAAIGPALALPMLVGDGPAISNVFGVDLERTKPWKIHP